MCTNLCIGEFMSTNIVPNSVVQELNSLYSLLDPIREELYGQLGQWDIPEVVVFGIESVGKSTILERIALQRLFPKGEDLCTRMIIRVELRNSTVARDPVLYVKQKNKSGADSIISGPGPITVDSIQHEMDKVIQQEHKEIKGISTNTYLLVQLQGPDLPNLNLVDVPGIVTAVSENSDPKMPENTKRLVEDVIESSKDRAIFLAILEASDRPNGTPTTTLLTDYRNQIGKWTVAVFTKCDQHLPVTIKRNLAKMQNEFRQTCILTANHQNDTDFVTQSNAEKEYFTREHFQNVLCGTDILVEHIGALYQEHLKTKWVGQTLSLLEKKIEYIAKDIEYLGYVENGQDTVRKVCASVETLWENAHAKQCSVWMNSMTQWRANVQKKLASSPQNDIQKFQQWASCGSPPKNGLLANLLRLTQHLLGSVFGSLQKTIIDTIEQDIVSITPSVPLRFGLFSGLRDILEEQTRLFCDRQQTFLFEFIKDQFPQSIPFWSQYNYNTNTVTILNDDVSRCLRSIEYAIWDRLCAQEFMVVFSEKITDSVCAQYHTTLSDRVSPLQNLKTRLFEIFQLPSDYSVLHAVITVGTGTLSHELVNIPRGTFEMGALEGDVQAVDSEKPRHQVTISRDFFVGKYPVTQGLYESVMGKNPSNFKGSTKPVENVSWYDAVSFCNKLSALEGRELVYTIDGTNVRCNFDAKGYRLLTEAEWEYCARSGQRFKYSGSDTVDDVAWYSRNSGKETHPVGLKKPNGFGLYDMSGNVYEWVWDFYGGYSSGTQVDPQGPTSGSDRVYRGGSWHNSAPFVRVSNRRGYTPASTDSGLGFRLGLTP